MSFNKIFSLSMIALSLNACSSVSEKGQETPNEQTIVQTDKGLVRGYFRNGALEFRGIPYAAAPTGDLRWAMPEPRAPWKGILDAKNFGSACPQVARYNLTEASNDEDCLFVNVSVPSKSVGKNEKLPVMVWIHGGAFVGGGGNLYRLDALAREGGVIVVSMNYRLGALGFLAHPALPKKVFALEDQRAAIRWVKQNIAAFGGDPNNITVGGESAGAASMCAHLSSPGIVKGLFQKALVQSAGCTFPVRSFDEAQATGLKVATHSAVKCDDPKTALSCLRKAPLGALLAAQTDVAGSDVTAFAISTNNETLPTKMSTAFKTGKILKVPMIMGGCQDELRLYVGYDVQAGAKITPETFPLAIKKLYGQTPEEQKKNVPAKVAREYALKAGDVPAEKLGSMMSDYVPTPGINNCLYLHAANLASKKTTVYQFEFADADAPVLGVGIAAKPDPGFKMGAVHSSELNYMFPKLDNTSKINAPDLSPASQKLSDQMIAYWSNFARTGVPSAPGAPAWPKYKGPKTVLRLDPGNVKVYDAAKAHHCDFWRANYPNQL